MQGDCLSAILFIYYLARCLDELKKEDDIQPDVFYIAPKYADDITFVTTSKEMINKIKETILVLWFSNQQDSFTNMIADGSAWGLMYQFRLK